MLKIDPAAYVFAALLILLLPLDWLLAAFFAAAFHEACHAGVIVLLGGKIYGIQIGIGGASMETALISRKMEVLSAAAGPMGSFLLVSLCHIFPKLAVCGMIQGLYNLIPVFPLDGGRILRCVLERVLPENAAHLEHLIAVLAAGALAVFWFLIFRDLLAVILGGIWILRARIRKRPCKRSRIRVQ